MPTKVYSACLNGLDASIVNVEADSGGGDFGQIAIVGLPDAAVSESKERVKSALRNCGLPFPRRRITVNLAPADLKKRGPVYDLPIALAILALKNDFRISLSGCLIIGELSLDGRVRPVNGMLSMALAAKKAGLTELYVPEDNALEAGLAENLTIYPVHDLAQIINHFLKKVVIGPAVPRENPTPFPVNRPPDLGEIMGQEKAKRALEIAAAGGHNILLSGPPGSGKSLLAKSMPGILPPLAFEEKLEITKIYSAAGELKSNRSLIACRPFRAPHHSASAASLIGGGSLPHPGEISLAHRGVLFLDEFPEFSRRVIESLRQPLEEGLISVNRSAGRLEFPAKFILLAAMNPCPCGHYGDTDKKCLCEPFQVNRYRHRLSGPIMDRIDLHVEMTRLRADKLNGAEPESSHAVQTRVSLARQRQSERFKGRAILTNSEMDNRAIKEFCVLGPNAQELLAEAFQRLGLSVRSYCRILKIARTIADLEAETRILTKHLAEALQYRPKLE